MNPVVLGATKTASKIIKVCDVGMEPVGGESNSAAEQDVDSTPAESNPSGRSHDGEGSSESEDSSGENGQGSDSSSSDDSSDGDDDEEEGEEEDLLAAAYKERPKAPPALKPDGAPTDLQFRPDSQDVAIATFDGDVNLYTYDQEKTELKRTYEIHEEATRCVCFGDDGKELFTVSKDGELAVVDVETGDIIELISDIHEDGAHALLPIDHYLCATGDADGVVKLFDVRAGKCVMESTHHSDVITSMVVHPDKKILVVSSADGTIGAFNVRAKRFEVQSEDYKEDIMALALVRSDTKLVAATNKGMVYIFDWDKFGYHSATFGRPSNSGMNSMVPVGDRTVIVGHDDGVLRAVHLFPNRILGVVGQHEETVDKIDVSPDGDFLASTDYEVVRFWNVSYLKSVKVTDKEKGNNKAALEKNLPSSRYQDATNFFAEMDD